jgi:hypothetical protein
MIYDNIRSDFYSATGDYFNAIGDGMDRKIQIEDFDELIKENKIIIDNLTIEKTSFYRCKVGKKPFYNHKLHLLIEDVAKSPKFNDIISEFELEALDELNSHEELKESIDNLEFRYASTALSEFGITKDTYIDLNSIFETLYNKRKKEDQKPFERSQGFLFLLETEQIETFTSLLFNMNKNGLLEEAKKLRESKIAKSEEDNKRMIENQKKSLKTHDKEMLKIIKNRNPEIFKEIYESEEI